MIVCHKNLTDKIKEDHGNIAALWICYVTANRTKQHCSRFQAIVSIFLCVIKTMGENKFWWEIVAIVDITVEILSNSDRYFFFFYLLMLCFVLSMRTLPKSFKACNTIKRTKKIWRHTVLQQWKKINVPLSCLNPQFFQVIIIMKDYGMICVRLLFDAKQKVYSGIAEPSPRMWAGVSSSQQRQKAVVKSNRFLAAKHSHPFKSEFDLLICYQPIYQFVCSLQLTG